MKRVLILSLTFLMLVQMRSFAQNVGINETSAAQNIQAWYYYGSLTVKTSEGHINIGIFNIQGQNLQNYYLQGNGTQTRKLNLPAGVYFAHLVSEGNMQTVKMIVQ